jgi:hypothetical protein
MTNFFGPAAAVDTNAGFPGAAPLGTGLMQGNPSNPSGQPQQALPGNQNAPQQLTATQLSNGNVIASSVPTNVLTTPGTDSLLAQMSRGQVIMADSTYGQSGFIPANGGAANPNIAATTPVLARTGNALTYPATQQNYTGN